MRPFIEGVCINCNKCLITISQITGQRFPVGLSFITSWLI